MTTLKTTLASLLLVILPEIFSCSKDTELSENKNQSEIKNNLSNIEHNESAQILILGGGYSASGNQISLESNVKYFQRIKPILQLEEKISHTYFADGNDSGRDIQFFDPKFVIPEINQIMAELFGKSNGLANQYRSNSLNPDGSSSVQSVDRWFKLLKNSDLREKSLLYFTGHGGKGESKKLFNTSIYLWNNAKIRVSELVRKIETLPKQKPIILVMVQCYSGGFSNVIFKEGDPKKEFIERPTAGFFSTLQSRVAAGCTPDIREENYHEYSTYFWEALSGRSRLGKKITKPDYNGDGKTSLLEAHSYVSIHSNTIDIPVKTSDTLLRKYLTSTKTETKVKKENEGLLGKLIQKLEFADQNETSSVKKLDQIKKSEFLLWATPEEKAVFLGLSENLKLKEDYPAIEIKKLLEDLKKEKEAIEKERKKATDQKNKFREELRKKIKGVFPEVANPYHPVVSEILSTEKSQSILNIINQNDFWKKILIEKGKIKSFENQKFLIEKKEVKLMRLRRCLENIKMLNTLVKSDKLEQQKNFQKLQELERLTLDQL